MSNFNKQLISIIIPVYNTEQYIAECIDSVISQTYQNWEIVLINDCSTDNSLQIMNQYCKAYPTKIKLINNKQNCGQGLSRNFGIEDSIGDWLFFLDSDDMLEFNALEVLMKELTYGEYDIILGNCYNLKNGTKLPRNTDLVAMYNFSPFSLGMYAWGTLFRREFWFRNGFTFGSYKYAEDILLISNIWSKTKKIKAINDYIYDYRVNENSITHAFQSFETIKTSLLALLSNTIVQYPNNDELVAFALSNSYNFIRMVASPIEKYKLFLLLKSYIPKYPLHNEYAFPPLISYSKSKKIKKIYATSGLYFLIKPDINWLINLFTKHFRK